MTVISWRNIFCQTTKCTHEHTYNHHTLTIQCITVNPSYISYTEPELIGLLDTDKVDKIIITWPGTSLGLPWKHKPRGHHTVDPRQLYVHHTH